MSWYWLRNGCRLAPCLLQFAQVRGDQSQADPQVIGTGVATDDLIERFSDRYPRLYHMAESGSWCSVREHGLLSTSALLDLFEISGSKRREIESEWRPNIVPIGHPTPRDCRDP